MGAYRFAISAYRFAISAYRIARDCMVSHGYVLGYRLLCTALEMSDTVNDG